MISLAPSLRALPVVLTLVSALVLPLTLNAQNAPCANDKYGLNCTASVPGFTTSADPNAQLEKTVANIVKTLLALTGVLFMALVIMAGDLWMTAGGNEQQVEKARSIITNAVLGLIAILAAWVATDFVVSTVIDWVA